MEETKKEQSVDDLVAPAKECLVDLLDFDDVQIDQWFMRLYTDGRDKWRPLSNDAAKNNAAIRGSIRESKQEVKALALAFCGMADVKGKREQVAYTQYFRREYHTGLVLGRRIKKQWITGKLYSHGSFLIMGQCQNIWF